MRATVNHRTVVVLIVLAATIGPAGVHAQQEADAKPTTLSPAEFEALYRARTESARMRFTEADVEFVTGMIGHHAQAIVMSRLVPTHGAGSSVQTLAARITNAQQDEIALMRRWLEDRGQPVPQVRIDGLNLEINVRTPTGQPHRSHGHAMPGMLTQAQLEELDAARALEFDRLFLTYMIQHHGGAVTMVDDLLAVDGAGQDRAVFKLASDIQVDQITEIERMKQMLDTMAEQGDGR
jgi:uncharacterized protein (DUF305 family)